jgi:putative phosphoesterase
MGRFIIASDIHGSGYWCEKLLDAVMAEEPQKVLLLGDLLYHGPRNPLPDGHDVKRVIELLSSIKEKLICVRGNCDAEVDQMVLPFPCLADFSLFSFDERTFYLTHGHLFSLQNLPPMASGTVLLNGHTHIPCYQKLGDIHYANCGSVALPKEDSPHSYILYEDGKLYWKDLETGGIFDVETL